MMGISRIAAWTARLLVATSVAGCATQAGDAIGVKDDKGHVSLLGKSVIGPSELDELKAQPNAEKRRRLDAVLAAHPADLPARFLRLQAEFDSSDDDATLSDSQTLLKDPALRGGARLQVLHLRAEALVHARRPGEAIPVADEALTIDDADAEALFARGWARYRQDEYQTEAALADLDRALQLDPDQGIGHYRRAVVLQARGVLDRAAQDFELAVRLAPGDAPSHREYGVLLYQTRNLDGALAQFDIALRLAPSDPDVRAWRAQTHLASGRAADSAADERHIDELGLASVDVAMAYARVADALEDQLDFAGAERQFRHSLAIAADPTVAYSLARLQWFNGHFDQPVAFFRERAMARDSGNYMPLWLFIARGRAQPAEEAAARTELAALAPPHEPREWTDTLVDMLLGKATLDAALAQADAAPNYLLKAGRRCEADYYAAEELLMHGQKEAASRLLQEAYWVCPSTYIEARAVVAQRRLLDAGSPAH
jgi:tetratricopeptide (TPR) repeat protein